MSGQPGDLVLQKRSGLGAAGETDRQGITEAVDRVVPAVAQAGEGQPLQCGALLGEQFLDQGDVDRDVGDGGRHPSIGRDGEGRDQTEARVDRLVTVRGAGPRCGML
ncbi:hypothetical protein C1706_10990 [Propioniciclava flava]|uniref:Uncharacterized protein n=1 Tax=Propioniciclava flava TaxID=2072026 RepID=A0A4Q2EIE3_9ACTN|nr:hypothetical protein C1706_10990 [Propioniciclava flava]